MKDKLSWYHWLIIALCALGIAVVFSSCDPHDNRKGVTITGIQRYNGIVSTHFNTCIYTATDGWSFIDSCGRFEIGDTVNLTHKQL